MRTWAWRKQLVDVDQAGSKPGPGPCTSEKVKCGQCKCPRYGPSHQSNLNTTLSDSNICLSTFLYKARRTSWLFWYSLKWTESLCNPACPVAVKLAKVTHWLPEVQLGLPVSPTLLTLLSYHLKRLDHKKPVNLAKYKWWKNWHFCRLRHYIYYSEMGK